MKAQTPKLVQDVYSDLRDRRLLIIAIALVMAIVAVPFLLGGSDPDATTAGITPAEPALDGEGALDAVVLAESSELRDSRRRLGGLHSKNPFKQQLTKAPNVGGGTGGGGGGSGSGIETQESLAAEVAAAEDVTAAAVSSAEPAAVPTDSVEPVEEVPAVEPEEAEEVTKVVSFTIDVKLGPNGDARVIRDVEEGDFLPGENSPLVQYLRSESDGSSSSFVVSPDVTGASGEGNCAPDRANCDFLQLGVGEEQQLENGATGETYRIKLLGVTRQELIVTEDATPPE